MSRPTADAIVESILDKLNEEREGVKDNLDDILTQDYLHKVIREERSEDFTSNSIISEL